MQIAPCGGKVGQAVSLPVRPVKVRGKVAAGSRYYATFESLVPALIAIVLALVTEEVYSSLFIGIVTGAALR